MCSLEQTGQKRRLWTALWGAKKSQKLHGFKLDKVVTCCVHSKISGYDRMRCIADVDAIDLDLEFMFTFAVTS